MLPGTLGSNIWSGARRRISEVDSALAVSDDVIRLPQLFSVVSGRKRIYCAVGRDGNNTLPNAFRAQQAPVGKQAQTVYAHVPSLRFFTAARVQPVKSVFGDIREVESAVLGTDWSFKAVKPILTISSGLEPPTITPGMAGCGGRSAPHRRAGKDIVPVRPIISLKQLGISLQFTS